MIYRQGGKDGAASARGWRRPKFLAATACHAMPLRHNITVTSVIVNNNNKYNLTHTHTVTGCMQPLTNLWDAVRLHRAQLGIRTYKTFEFDALSLLPTAELRNF